MSVHRGALLYSLPIAANYSMYGHHFGTDAMSSDYYLSPTSEWRYALDIDPVRLWCVFERSGEPVGGVGHELSLPRRSRTPPGAPAQVRASRPVRVR